MTTTTAPHAAPMLTIVVLMAVLKHLVDAALLLAVPSATHSVGISTILMVVGQNPQTAGLAVASTASVALLAIHPRCVGWKRRALLAPQQFWLTVAACGALASIISGQYADGYAPVGGSMFILGDQFPRLLFATLHGIIMVRAR